MSPLIGERTVTTVVDFRYVRQAVRFQPDTDKEAVAMGVRYWPLAGVGRVQVVCNVLRACEAAELK